MDNHRPKDTFALGFYNGIFFGTIYSFSRFNYNLPEGLLNLKEKTIYLTRHALFFAILYGGYLFSEQYFIVNKQILKSKYRIKDHSYQVISSLCCSIGSLIISVPIYYLKNKNNDFTKGTILLFAAILFSINYIQQVQKNSV